MFKTFIKNPFHLYTTLLIIIYGVGIVGLNLYPEVFKPITPLNLILSAFYVLCFDKSPRMKLVLFLLLVWMGGWIIEWIGVRTGEIFGHYYYGPTLGFQLDGIPVLIGMNWFILSYCSANMSVWLFPSAGMYVRISLAAAFMVALDACIEPLCENHDFWYWESTHAPLQNYVAWYMFGWLFQFLFFKWQLNQNNSSATVLYMVQAVFFLSLYISFRLLS